jgi:hypothetical protein
LAKLTADDAVENDQFGRSVSISGNRVVVGAYGDDDNGSFSGSAYLFSVQQFLANGDPHLRAFNGATFNFDGLINHVFNFITDLYFQLNVLLSAFSVGSTYGTWITKLAILTPSSSFVFDPVTCSLMINRDSISHSTLTSIEEGSIELQRHEDGRCGGMHADVSSVGYVVKASVRYGGDQPYLDLQIDMNKMVEEIHGVLGQTAKWGVEKQVHSKAKNGKGLIEGEMEDYEVKDGLEGRSFTFNLFGKKTEKQVKERGRRSVEVMQAYA